MPWYLRADSVKPLSSLSNNTGNQVLTKFPLRASYLTKQTSKDIKSSCNLPLNAHFPVEINILVKYYAAATCYTKSYTKFNFFFSLFFFFVLDIPIIAHLFRSDPFPFVDPWRSTFVPRAERIADGNSPTPFRKQTLRQKKRDAVEKARIPTYLEV